MADETEMILEQEELLIRMDESRESLADKIQRLEEKVTETVESATATVANATASVMQTVQDASASVSETVGSVSTAVQGTVDTVRHSVEETMGSVKETFDLSLQVERNPWLMLLGSAVGGFCIGRFVIPGSPRPYEAPRQRERLQGWEPPEESSWRNERIPSRLVSPPEIPVPLNKGAGESQPHPVGAGTQVGTWINHVRESFAPEVEKLEGVVIGMALGALRDMVTPHVPVSMQQSVAEVIDSLTEKMGGKCTPPAAEQAESAGEVSNGRMPLHIPR